MPTESEIQTERQRLYESAALREDINDDEATVLLEWGEKHVVRLGQGATDNADLEQKARFLRQLLKNINRFVGQRQFNDRAGQLDYMEKVTKWLANPLLGFKNHTPDELLDKLPSDTKDMAATLKALLDAIDPGNSGPRGTPDAPPQDRLGTLRDAVSAQSAQGEGAPPNRPATLRDTASQAAHQVDPQARAGLPVPEDVRQSVIDQLAEDRREKPDDSSYRAQPDGQTDAPSLLDSIRRAAADLLQEKHPDPEDNVALESRRQSLEKTPDEPAKNAALDALRQSVKKTRDEPASSGENRGGNMSPHSQQPAEHRTSIRDQRINQPHTNEEDEEHGKDTK